ncbi:dienelactone hydrolase family protein [Iamia sp.]|uniref:dienelactone hydrolase family protein n=1 Tax=Iamia sp. TaxID=2722710 RepID=UPI002C0BECFD|nr:dienelactone hydrolase family protein [Iamia sp.]HXH56535.1 dienelactone hydrolase family protein [Iamia sp.]
MRTEGQVDVPVGSGDAIRGDLIVPGAARGVVVFAHGSGSSRHSPRNRAVAAALHDRALGTLLMDLLTEDEERSDRRTGELRFDIGLLAERLVSTVSWLTDRSDVGALPVGFFGASTGAGAALVAAARPSVDVAAVVSRGGRPDLAGESLDEVEAPTLLIVGGLDPTVIDLNRQAHDRMRAERSLEIVPGATHLFEEPGALDHVARMAGDWFTRHLTAPSRPGRTP